MHDDAEVADDNANTQIVTGQRSRVHSKASLTLRSLETQGQPTQGTDK